MRLEFIRREINMPDLGVKRERPCARCKYFSLKYYEKPCCYCCNFDHFVKEETP
jgi:hypothetical protein